MALTSTLAEVYIPRTPKATAKSLTETFSPGCPTAGGYVPLHYPWLRQPQSPTSNRILTPPKKDARKAGATTTIASATAAPPASGTRARIEEDDDEDTHNDDRPAGIELGTFIAFSLAKDVLADRYSDIPGLSEAIRDAPAARYIGLVTSSYIEEVDDDDNEVEGSGKLVETLVVQFVSQSPPDIEAVGEQWVDIGGVDASRAPSEGGKDYAPLRTNVFFPILKAKQWTTLGVHLRVEEVHESSLEFYLRNEEFSRFEDLQMAHYAELGPEDKQVLECYINPANTDPLPVVVWKDVRVAMEECDPLSFAEEVLHLEGLISDQWVEEEGPESEYESDTDGGAHSDYSEETEEQELEKEQDEEKEDHEQQ